MNISQRVTPNIQVSLAWEKVRVFRLSGAHLCREGHEHQEAVDAAPSAPPLPQGSPGKGDLAMLLHHIVVVIFG